MTEEKKANLLNKYTSTNSNNVVEKKNNLTIKKDNFELSGDLTKPPKKTYTPLRVEDSIMEAFREYCRVNKLVSHGIVMNEVLRDFIEKNM